MAGITFAPRNECTRKAKLICPRIGSNLRLSPERIETLGATWTPYLCSSWPTIC